MTEQSQTIDYGIVLSSPEERNRVLRNTYWLLALSMLPTVLGAWLGVETWNLGWRERLTTVSHLAKSSIDQIRLSVFKWLEPWDGQPLGASSIKTC